MTEVRVGLLGAGYIVKSHARALRALPGIKLQAVCDQALGRAKSAAAEFGIPETYDSVEALAASSCDAVHVLLPPAHHVGPARQLIEAGKHVFVEKPMGLDAAECQELADLATARDRHLGVNHNFLFAPAYQPIRDAVRSGALGPVDYLSANWLYALPLLQFGPFDNWIVRSPGNLVLEIMPHLAAFVVDLLGEVDLTAARADNPIDLPGDQRVYRRWSVLGRSALASFNLTLSVAPGQTDRSLALRALGGVGRFDLERGLGRIEEQGSDNPVFENLRSGRRHARQMSGQARRDFLRYAARTLRKQPGSNPFEESVFQSIAAFYEGLRGKPDPRLSGQFGSQVIDLCQDIVAMAGVEPAVAGLATAPSIATVPSITTAPASQPRVLVVGGTGFIGRQLVRRLAGEGVAVRVLTRNLGAARIELGDLDVELMRGSHADRTQADRALEGIETVYHLAKAEGQRWQDYLDNDVEPTRTLAEAALARGVRRFIYTGTIDSYDSASDRAVITGATPLDPAIATRNLYARSKAACEALLKTLARQRGLPLVIVRPGIVIGAGSPPAHLGVGHFVSNTRVDYWGDGRNPLPFVLVDDVAEGLLQAHSAPDIEGQSFLLADAPLLSARDYVSAIEARSGVKVTAHERPIWRYWAADALKEGAKHAIHHPNRRAASYHDWACKAHRSRYDATETRERLGWRPAGTAGALIERGVNASVDRFMR